MSDDIKAQEVQQSPQSTQTATEQLSLAIDTNLPVATTTIPKESVSNPDDVIPSWGKSILEKLESITKKDAEKEAAAKAAQERDEEAKATEDGTLAELLVKRKEEAEAEKKALRQERIQTALERAGISAGIRDFEFLRLVDKSKINIDETGSIVGANQAIAALKEKHPTLFNSAAVTGERQASPPPLAGGPASSTPQQNPTLTKEQEIVRKNFGWLACKDRAKQGARTVTFHEAMLDEKFPVSNPYKE